MMKAMHTNFADLLFVTIHKCHGNQESSALSRPERFFCEAQYASTGGLRFVLVSGKDWRRLRSRRHAPIKVDLESAREGGK